MGHLSNPVQVLFDRLAYQSAKGYGRILDGMKWTPIPTTEGEGKQDLPSLRVTSLNVREAYRPGALIESTMNLSLNLATRRDEGIPAHLSWVEKVADSLEIDMSGTINPGLSGTTRMPFTVEISANTVLDVSIVTTLTVTVMPNFRERANRRN